MRVCKLRALDELLESVMSVLLVRDYKKKRHRRKPMTPCYIERRVRVSLADRYVAGSA
jgi:hypothetical protein